jgi:peptidoglycan DL-endopeptidase CwlO
MQRIMFIFLAFAMFGVIMVLTAAPSHAAVIGHRRQTALRWAEQQAGCWYSFGGTSCGPGFDCSGLVMEAYQHAGVSLPRTTYEMIGSSRLVEIPASERKPGDLAFYGSGHVELVTSGGTFGALEPGTRVGWHHPSGSWVPTMYFRLRW